MNLREDIKSLKTGKRELRKFGLLVGVVLLGLGVLLLLRGKWLGPYLAVPGIALMVLGAALPAALKYVYLAWMSAAFVVGFVVSHVILTLFFYLVITPTGLLARLLGRDFLHLHLDRKAASYWVRRPPASKAPEAYERQF